VPADDPVLSLLSVGAPSAALQETYRSLAAQTDRRWEWCVAVPGEGAAHEVSGLPLDPRLVRVSVGSVQDPAAALARAAEAARGDHLMQVRPGDLLAPGTVSAVADSVPAGGWGYADEQQQAAPEQPADIWEKPDHAPELLRSQPYPVRSCFLPRTVLTDLGGVRSDLRSAAWYDAVLRVSEVAAPPVHIRRPLVTRTDPDPARRWVPGEPAEHARAVLEHCRRTGVVVSDVTPRSVAGQPVGQRLHRPRQGTPGVSIVIPTRGSTSVVRGAPRVHVVELVRSIWTEERYPDLELVVVYDAETPPEVLDDLREIAGHGVVLQRYDDWFHFSRKCNLGAVAARGEYLCFLNDDMEVLSPRWLEEMVSLLADPDVGAVGARLLFGDGTIQHVGHHFVGGLVGHAFFTWRGDTMAQGGIAHLTGERSGVTAACLLMRAVDFRNVGGFSDAFPLNYNDVDMCLKLREQGFRLLYTPYAELFHFESQTREPRILRTERALLQRRWSLRIRTESFVHQPDLTRTARISRPTLRERVRGRFRTLPAATPSVEKESHD
jgi:GT2 family glycosyltransferase